MQNFPHAERDPNQPKKLKFSLNEAISSKLNRPEGGNSFKVMIRTATKKLLYRTATLLAVLCIILSPAYAYEGVITNERSGDILKFDASGKVLDVKKICRRPRGMTQEQKSTTLYIACSDDDKIILVDPQSLNVLGEIQDIPGAMSLRFHEPSNRLFATNEGFAQTTVIDLSTRKTIAILETGLEPDGVEITGAGDRIFIASENAGLVHVFDGNSYERIGDIVTNLRPRRLALLNDQLWISTEMGSRVEIFQTTTLNKISEVIFAPKGFRSEQMTPVDVKFSRDETRAFVALGAANHVAIVNTKTLDIEKYILVGRRAWGLAVTQDDKHLIVLNGLSDDFTIIDLDTLRPQITQRAGLRPHAVEVLK